MKNLIKDLWLAFLLIIGASAVLLLSDLGNRQNEQGNHTESDPLTEISLPGEEMLPKQGPSIEPERIILNFADLQDSGVKLDVEMIDKADLFHNVASKNGRPFRLAIITLVENPLLEDAEKGVVAGLDWSGLKSGEDYLIEKYSAQGEISQLSQIIQEILNNKPDVIVTVTTPAMVAVVNKVKDIPVVYTVASNPIKINLFKSGRPGNVCGVHDNPPVDLLLDMAREFDPDISSAGIVYDASQVNSVLSVEYLREAGKSRNIKILEATASSVSDLGMATQALIQKGAQAIILSADNLVTTGFSSIQRAAESAGVPVFTTEPQLVDQGATGAIGDSYYDWGFQSGKLAAKVIAGVPPSMLPISETEVKKRIDPKGSPGKKLSQKIYKIRLVLYSETAFAERCRDGIIDGIKKAGLVEGKDYGLKTYNAQGDISTLSSIMTAIKSENADLLMTVSTPTLQAALRQAGPETKIVFTGVGDAVGAGAGKSDDDHLPNVTGITTRSPFEGMAKIVKEMIPGVKKVGSLFTPSEVNSVLYKDWFVEELARVGIELVTVPVNSSADLAQAAIELCMNDIQAVCQIADNTTRQGFALVSRKAAEKNLPVFVFDSDEMADGATICFARDYYEAGMEAAEKAVRVLNGENPAGIPISNTKSEKLLYDPGLVRKYNLNISNAFLQKATVFKEDKK